ncbi:hypothetical protein SASPL_133349 [Salvia splendens]|uniref:Uncharacterized protein n=1 Tax=Salvia splendens TaxID=180675 RepID=A0A8X8X4R2_SALSN|nr:hypothetical protein SASPL_133349 [Salvia splendens]
MRHNHPRPLRFRIGGAVLPDDGASEGRRSVRRSLRLRSSGSIRTGKNRGGSVADCEGEVTGGVDREKVARLWVIPKYAEDEAESVWIEAAGFNPLHCANAWDEDGDDTVCVVATNTAVVDRLMENIDCADMTMEMVVVDEMACY